MTSDYPYILASSLPFWSSRAAPGCVSNSMMARKMPFIIFTSRANNKPSRLFHIPHPQNQTTFKSFCCCPCCWCCPCRLCRAMAYYYYLCVLYFRVLLLHFSYTAHTHIHTPSHSGTLAGKPYIFIDFIGYNKSHTQRQQLHLLPLTVVECVGLAHTLFRWVASGARDLYTFITSPRTPPSPSTNPQFKILSSSALLLKGRSVCLIVQAKILIKFIS